MARVIVADDSLLVRRMFQRLLGEAGHEVLAVGNGLDAVERALDEDVALIILDVLMPRMNGYVACRLLKSEPSTRGIPILMLSGQSDAGDRYWGLETGADCYVTKDAPPERLLELVEGLLSDPGPARPPFPPRSVHSESDILGRVSELLDRKLFETTILSELGQAAGSLEHVEEAFTSVMEVVARAVDYAVGSLAFVDGDDLEIMVMARRSLAPRALEAFETQVAASVGGEGGSGPPLRAVMRRFSAAPGGEEVPRIETSPEGFESFSVTHGGGRSGLMALAGPSVTQAADEHRAFLGRVASQALIVTENARLFGRIRDLSLRDGLTGLYNHRHSMELVAEEFDRSRRYGTALSVLMIDLDHFKRFNDEHGHLAGDTALRVVGRLLSGALRTVDHLGRYGGEEFVAILPHTDNEAARGTAERLRSIVEAHDFGPGPKLRRITASIGVATRPSSDAGSSVELLEEADRALYRAKEAGRNRVE
jgi:two-component system cell cycle response regulator